VPIFPGTHLWNLSGETYRVTHCSCCEARRAAIAEMSRAEDVQPCHGRCMYVVRSTLDQPCVRRYRKICSSLLLDWPSTVPWSFRTAQLVPRYVQNTVRLEGDRPPSAGIMMWLWRSAGSHGWDAACVPSPRSMQLKVGRGAKGCFSCLLALKVLPYYPYVQDTRCHQRGDRSPAIRLRG
jgi:hypothetical protein